jgi:2-polyprenyl-6-methoxyphenol hydroxylase-like FAD-dependent oxidoreductase
VRLGVVVDRLMESADGTVRVRFSDGREDSYDLVVGADGVQSQVRRLLFPDAPGPRFTGQGCWRVVAPRPPEVVSAEFYLGGPHKVGVNPCSATQLYMFLLNRLAGDFHIAPDEHLRTLQGLMQGYGGRIATIRAQLGPESSIVFRPLESVLVPAPWYRGRTVLIGDAAHATTPHLASGAGMAVEDALVLGDELDVADSVEAALRRFMERRWERCRLVVENSLKIGELEMAGSDPSEQQRLMGESSAALAAPL